MSRKKYTIIFSLLLTIHGEAWCAPAIKPITPGNASELFKFVLSNEDEKNTVVTLIKYDPEIYELAYATYLQSKNIKDAYALASAAVEQNPDSHVWRTRLAQVALWNQEPGVALQQYEYMARHFKDADALVKGLTLARSMHDDDRLAQLMLLNIDSGNNTDKNWEEYVNTMLRLGEINTLGKVLQKHQNVMSHQLYLDSFSKLYLISNNPQEQLKVLQQLNATTGTKPDFAEQLSVIYLTQGNISQAEKVMNKARKNTKASDYKFWDAYAKVSYLASKSNDELYAYQQLVKQKKPDITTYTKLMDLTFSRDPELAYKYAMEGRAQYPNNFYLTLTAFSLLNTNNQSINFPELLASTPDAIKKQLKYDSMFWNAQADYWRVAGDDNQVIQSYLGGIHYAPDNVYLKSSLIYFLIEKNDVAQLKRILPLWQLRVAGTPELYGPYAQAYAQLNNPTMSRLYISLYYDQFEANKNNTQWLISFKDALENSNFPIDAKKINKYTWPIYLNYLRAQKSTPGYEQILNYVKLSMQEAAGDPTAVALSQLQNTVNKDTELLMLTWALKHNNFSLARATYLYYLSLGIEPPSWAILSIALERHDRQLEHKLITGKEKIASYRDHIRAAIDVDAIPHAQTVAFKELSRHRHDSDLYDNFFVPVMLRTADNFYVSQESFQYGNVEGPRTKLSYTHFLKPSVSLTPYNSIWFSRNIPGGSPNLNVDAAIGGNQALATVPAHDERAGMIIHTQQRRGNLDLDIAYRNNLTSFLTARLTRTYPVYDDLSVSAALGYQQEANDTAGLLVGGMKNDVSLGLVYNVLAKDTFFANYTQNTFSTQDGQYLSNGGQAVVRHEHKFWKSYPDWTLSPYGVVTQYYTKTRKPLTGNILEIIPAGAPQNVNFLIPINSAEYGLTLSFGQNFIDDYTHRWRPLGSVTVSQNSAVGIGKLFNLGLSGMVFGRDHLLFYYEWGSNQGQGLQTSQLIKVSYQIYL